MKPNVIDEQAQGVVSLAFSGDGRLLAVGDDAGNVRLWSIEAGGAKTLLDFQVELEALHALAIDATGKRIAAVGIGGGALYDARGQRSAIIPLGGGRELQAACFLPDGRLLLAGDDERCRLLDASAQKELGQITCGERNSSIVLHPEKKCFLITAARQGGSSLVQGELLATGLAESKAPPIRVAVDALSAAAFSADGERILLPGRDLLLCERKSGRVLAALGYDGRARAATQAGSMVLDRFWSQAVRIEPDLFACATPEGGAIYCLDSKTGRVQETLAGHAGGTTALAAAGKLLASAGLDHKLRLWR